MCSYGVTEAWRHVQLLAWNRRDTRNTTRNLTPLSNSLFSSWTPTSFPSFNWDTSLSLSENYFFQFSSIQLHWVLFQPQRSLHSSGKKLCSIKALYKVLPMSLSLSCFFLSFFFFFPPQPLTLFIIIIKHSFALLTNWKALAGGHKGGVSGL